MDYPDNIEYLLAVLLENEGVGTFATDIFIGKEPNTPDNCITLYLTGGTPDDTLSLTNRTNEISTLQVRVRNNDFLTAHAKIEECIAVFGKAKYKTVSDSTGDILLNIWQTSLPNVLIRDTTNRVIMSFDFSCRTERA